LQDLGDIQNDQFSDLEQGIQLWAMMLFKAGMATSDCGKMLCNKLQNKLELEEDLTTLIVKYFKAYKKRTEQTTDEEDESSISS